MTAYLMTIESFIKFCDSVAVAVKTPSPEPFAKRFPAYMSPQTARNLLAYSLRRRQMRDVRKSLGEQRRKDFDNFLLETITKIGA